MTKMLAQFLVLEDGAITVDWVVLTAALIGVGMLILTPIAYQTDSSAASVATFIKAVPVGAD